VAYARGQLARRLFDEGMSPADPEAPLAPALSSGRASSAAPGAAGTPGASGAVDVTIHHDGAAKVTARSKGNVNTPRITTAMPLSGSYDPNGF
jgi:hypothetical protein